jgi:hypothetical protein
MADSVATIARASARFFVPAFAVLVVLLIGLPRWAPAAAADRGSWATLAARNVTATAALFVVGDRFAGRGSREGGRLAILYLLLFAATLSMWAIDLVIALGTASASTVIPPYYFMGAYLGGVAWTALVLAWRAETISSPHRHDLGKLLFGFIAIWAYLLWSAYLPVWYGNLPSETGALVSRWRGPWKVVVVGVLFSVFAFPVAFLLPEATKRGRVTLAIAASSVLGGLLGERFLLVVPATQVTGDSASWLIGAGITLGMLGAFATLPQSSKVEEGESPVR